MTRPDPVAKSDAFDASLEKNPLVMNLVKLTKQHNTIIRWLGVALALSLTATIVALIAAFSAWSTAGQAKDAADAAQAAAKAAAAAGVQARAVCLSVNQGRHDSLKLWRYVLSFPPPPGETPIARKARLDATVKFRRYIDKAFAPKDCAHLKPSSTAPTFPDLSLGSSSSSASTRPASRSAGGQPEPGFSATRPTHHAASSPEPSRSPRPPSRSPAPSSSPSPTPAPIRSCLQHPVNCLPFNGESAAGGAAGGTADPPAGLLAVTAAALLVAVGGAWWRYCVSPRFRAPAGRTLRRSADRQEPT